MDLVAALPRLYFVRHGETDWNREFRFQGQRDVPLNETGRARVAALAAWPGLLAGTARVISSGETKAQETAQPLARPPI